MANSFTYKEFANILQDMENALIANQSLITDYNESSVIFQFLQAVATEIARVYLETRAGFDQQMVNLAYSVFGFQPKLAQPASGLATLAASVAPSVNTLISTGFQFAYNGQVYATTADVTLTAGSTSIANVPYVAQVAGSAGNIPAGVSFTLVSSLQPIVSATNQAAVTNGVDAETQSQLMSRFRQFIVGLGRCTTTGLIAGALAISGVRSAMLDEFFPPQNLTYTDPITGLSVTKLVNSFLYVESGNGYASSGVLNAVQLAIEGLDGGGGMRASGVRVVAQSPTIVLQNIVFNATYSPLFPQNTLLTLIQAALSFYVNNLPIGAGLVFNELVEVIMSVPGVQDVTITTPTANVPGVSTQVIRLGTVSPAFTLGTA